MAIATNEVQVTWPTAANSISVAFGASQTSETVTLSATAFQAQIQLKADNDGTPASGDTVDFYLIQSLGDPDGAGANEFATDTQGLFLGRLDTNADDPAGKVVELPVPADEAQVIAKNNSGGRAITVSATILEQTG